jgi:hypothetical protein
MGARSSLPAARESPAQLPPRNSLARLAKVEVQLVLHCCDPRSFVSLARCCRSTLAAAADPFALRHMSPVFVIPHFKSRARFLASLLRFAPVQLRLPMGDTRGPQMCGGMRSTEEMHLESVNSLNLDNQRCRVHVLDTRVARDSSEMTGVCAKQLSFFLASPEFTGLTGLKVHV